MNISTTQVGPTHFILVYRKTRRQISHATSMPPKDYSSEQSVAGIPLDLIQGAIQRFANSHPSFLLLRMVALAPPVVRCVRCTSSTDSRRILRSHRYFFFPLAAPMNLANSPYLHLLTPEEQVLCSTLRIIPRSYLTVKETLVREYARRGGKLRRREARDLVKIDVNKTSRIWDFLVQTGIMSVGIIDPTHSNQDAA